MLDTLIPRLVYLLKRGLYIAYDWALVVAIVLYTFAIGLYVLGH